jgi:hypothetical protein
MRRLSVGAIVLKILGLLLLTAAVLKGHELLTVPIANRGFWSWRPFLIFQVEFELALALWLLSGIYQSLAWLAGLLCFALFCGVTLVESLTGATSCGCFGAVHVRPLTTLLVVDVPAVVMLGRYPPPATLGALVFLLHRLVSTRADGQGSVHQVVTQFAPAVRHPRRRIATAALTLAGLAAITPVLALHEPPKVTATYEVLEPETWVGRELPILPHIDIADQLRSGAWITVFYHYDCPDCAKAIPAYEQMARDLAGKQALPRIALIAVPPWGRGPVGENSPCTLGHLARTKEWFVTTPAVALLSDGHVVSAWEGKVPNAETILQNILTIRRGQPHGAFTFSRSASGDALVRKGGENCIHPC